MQNVADHNSLDLRYHEIIASEYDDVVVAPRAFANDILFSVIDPLIPLGGAMLDIGCGTGHMLVRYARRFERAIGVDHSPAMLAQAKIHLDAKSLHNCTLVCADTAIFLRRSQEKFDLISCVGFLHHLEPRELAGLLQALSQRLAPDGVFLFAEPIEFDPASLPVGVAMWNAQSIATKLQYSNDAQDPDEAPLQEPALRAALHAAGMTLLAVSRGWELFPTSLPPTLEDRTTIWRLHYAHGSNGNVFCGLAGRS